MLPRLLSPLALLPLASALWPAPREISSGNTTLFIDKSIKITYGGKPLHYVPGYTPAAGPKCDDTEVIKGGVSRALGAIFDNNFVPWMLRPKGSTFEPDASEEKHLVKTLKISHSDKSNSGCYKPVADEVDESYAFKLGEDGHASIDAKTAIGVLRGLETFLQLFYEHTDGHHWYTTIAPVEIKDAPLFPYRGVLLDTARIFFSVKDIERTIDAISWNKMNRFHWHITDSQSWPLDIPALPELSAKGAYHPALTYSPEDVAHIHEFAAHRGVEVIMEVDMPGHIGSVQFAFPELIVAYNEIPFHWWCSEPPCGAFKLNEPAVDEFLETMFDDLLPRLSPYTSYFHTGGDELNRNDSMLDDGVGSNDTEVLRPLLQKFIDVNHDRVRKAGLVPVVWEELALEWDLDLGSDVIVQSWLGGKAIKTLTGKGHKVIVSDYNYYYLPCGRGQWMDYDNGEAFKKFYPFVDWCSPAKSWKLIYAYDPVAGLTEEEASKVLGGEVAVWTERIDATNLDGLLWPRASAMGEILWSGRYDEVGRNRSQYEVTPRLADLRERMLARGLAAEPVQMTFCTQGDDPLECARIV
ncbi:related to beta-hexosaminidase precursor [Cephalotrichum gorgonifer]|uniref:Beta-hexosaminidase n=1 Tax=Cephalotrichum gorgonifer TaxID=2041049 RepID=A0AAE8N191_9PEZI|nr:related to beta-hexosaminidase precursor [Cephalotrichum gorgonifer]